MHGKCTHVGIAKQLEIGLVDADRFQTVVREGVESEAAENTVDERGDEAVRAEHGVDVVDRDRGGRVGFAYDALITFEFGFEFLARDRAGVVVALDHVAAERAQKVDLLARLYALRHGGDAEPFRHADDRGDDRADLAAALEALKKFHVDLELVDVDVLEHVERGEAAAEIVDRDGEAVRVETLDDVDERLSLHDEGGLRELDDEVFGVHAVFFRD